MFFTALDTSGNTKDAKFIADFIIKIIEDKGPANIVAVCMYLYGRRLYSFISVDYGRVRTRLFFHLPCPFVGQFL